MPPAQQTVVPRAVALQYDGTNAAEVVDVISQRYPIDPNSYMVGDETDGVLTVITTDRDLWADIHVNVSDYVVAAQTGVQVVADTAYADRYVLLP